MIIYPAVDIKDGRCVRLTQGKFCDVTVYSDNPVEMALAWENLGAGYVHVIDLDGARTGMPQNLPVVGEIALKLSVPLQMGGGIRTMDTIKAVLDCGVKRAILGTSAVNDPDFLKRALNTFKGCVAVSIDARDGRVAIEGWEKTSAFNAVDFAMKMEELGAATIIYTDISRDGMLMGPNLKAMEDLAKAVQVEIIAAGGVSSVKDIRNLKNAGISGAIIGKALYTGDIDLREALAEAAK